MDFIIVLAVSAILVATGVISPKPEDNSISEEVKVVKTEEVTPPPPEPEPPAPEPEPEPEPPAPEPEPAKEPEPAEEEVQADPVQEE